ncbi:putative cytochrome P450 [Massarina eburnea CBS 473.64]|uniref:Putative cytochrome P450 n=1 Tax=Massarina eburnea CBS 473.64 TaxID=1395130 RepID=A0A6A6SAV0_9PLEO|nr:putative cytochrome P450 [Massarina eburnea CBS 473.64]
METPQTLTEKWQEARMPPAELLLHAAVALFSAYSISQIIYNIYFHPLKDVPGPLLARASLLWRLFHSMGGHWHIHMQNAHKRYGDVLRVSPNEVSFASSTAWKTIYGNRNGAPMIKSGFYDILSLGFDEPSLGSERNHRVALRKRELFADALSDRNLAEQEPIMQQLVSVFIEKIGKLGNTEGGLDMHKWFLYLSFDLTGKMAFGATFACLENETTHEWLELILPLFFVLNLVDNFRRLPFVVQLAGMIPMKWTNGIRTKIIQASKDQTAKRLQTTSPQNDFFDNTASKVHNGEVSEEEMASHLFTLSIAAGETTATSMTATLHHLLTNPTTLRNLRHEVRTTYPSSQNITIASTLKLPYLQAVLKESLRMHPLFAQGLPRLSPGAMIEGIYVPRGTEVYVFPWSTTHDDRYFHDPYTFDPERWLDRKCRDVKGASQPFILGPRVCPGKRFAYSQMSLQLAKLVYTYDMELLENSRNWREECRVHVLWWLPALNVRFRPRC